MKALKFSHVIFATTAFTLPLLINTCWAKDIPLKITNMEFSAPGTVSVGDAITYTNEDKMAHTFTVKKDNDTKFNKEIQPGQKATFVVDEPGQYNISCNYHPGMTTEFKALSLK